MIKSNYTIIIPSRLHSTRLAQKALIDIGGKPLVVQVALQAQKTNARIVIATDHEDIANVCKEYGLEYCMTSSEHQSGTDRLAECAEKLGLACDEIVVNVQGDEPFMSPQIINDVAQALVDNPDYRMSTAAHLIKHAYEITNPNVVKVVVNNNNKALYFSRAPIPWNRDAWQDTTLNTAQNNPEAILGNIWRHIGVYGFRVGFLKKYPTLPPAMLEKIEMLEQLRALYNGFDIYVAPTDIVPEAGIDTPDDFARATKKWQEIYG
ncbi:MAG: 3-deoxy-D-manno-octulosonate cytidylyltransferase [Pseudomonadota bacterium]|jgi:3-deoxy-manno-octulosonate cytidylyltransferase (CMP-KDO synthetase)